MYSFLFTVPRIVDEDDIDCCWRHLPEDVRKVIFDAGFYENRLPNENPDFDDYGD